MSQLQISNISDAYIKLLISDYNHKYPILPDFNILLISGGIIGSIFQICFNLTGLYDIRILESLTYLMRFLIICSD
jgi:hypothetical protein